MGVKNNVKIIYGFKSELQEDIDFALFVGGEEPSVEPFYEFMGEFFNKHEINIQCICSGDWYNDRYEEMAIGVEINEEQLNNQEFLKDLKEKLELYNFQQWFKKELPHEPQIAIIKYIW